MSVELSFEESLRETARLLSDVETGEVDADSAAVTIGKLVSTTPGARGFLVSFLTGSSSLADDPPPYIVEALKSAPPVVCDLLAKNLVMSSTMALTHKRNGDAGGEQGSLTVQRRTTELIKRMDLPEMNERLDDMWEGVTERTGCYADFLTRWQYDTEQLALAQYALTRVRTGR